MSERESLFSLAGMERLARDQMAAADATHRVTFAAIPPDALKALVTACKAAQDWVTVFDADHKTDVEWSNAMQRLRIALAVFTDE